MLRKLKAYVHDRIARRRRRAEGGGVATAVALANCSPDNKAAQVAKEEDVTLSSPEAEAVAALLELRDSDVADWRMSGCSVAKVVQVYDADTVRVLVLRDGGIIKLKLRILHIDAPEMAPRKPVLGTNMYGLQLDTDESMDIANSRRDTEIKMAKRSRNRLIELVTDMGVDEKVVQKKKDIQTLLDTNKKLVYVTYGIGVDKWGGRQLGEIFLGPNRTMSVASVLIQEGHAVHYEGKTKSTLWYQRI